MKVSIAIGLLLASLAAAHAFGLGSEGRSFGKLGASLKKGAGGGGGTTGALLLEDGTSILLLEDGSSFLCLEGGC